MCHAIYFVKAIGKVSDARRHGTMLNLDSLGITVAKLRLGSIVTTLSVKKKSAIKSHADKRLTASIREMVLHPLRTLIPVWSWKAAAWSALLRATTFFATNLRAGHWHALRAGLVEACFAIFAAGMMGAVSQRLRSAKPVWATALVVWLAMPLIMLLTQLGVHTLAHTQHMGTGLALSFCFAAIASAFSWYAMRRGAMLGGVESTAIAQDLRRLPQIILDFVLVVPKAILRALRKRR
jgi:hypothetical protein